MPSSFRFLERFAQIAGVAEKKDPADWEESSQKVWFLSRYLIEIALIEQRLLIYSPSLTAASALFLASQLVHKGNAPWTSDMVRLTGYQTHELRSCAKDLVVLLSNIKSCSLK